MSHILARESEFVSSQVTLRAKTTAAQTTRTGPAATEPTGAATVGTEPTRTTQAVARISGLRRSRVIEAPGPHLRALFVPHLRPALVDAFRLAVPTRRPEIEDQRLLDLKIDVQLTASGDRDFYGLHADGGPNRYRHRDVSFVYFVRTEPGCFTGGELRIEDAGNEGQERLIEPKDNRLVMFPSRRLHEIRPVSVPSREFRHSRFTVNGWVSLGTQVDEMTAGPGYPEMRL